MTNREKRCEDCTSFVKKNGVWCCDECFGQKCDDIDECPEGIELEEVEEVRAKGETATILHNASSADKREKKSKPRTVKVSDTKKQLFSEIFTNLKDIYGENAQIVKENKLIIVQIGGKTFKIDIVETRPKK